MAIELGGFAHHYYKSNNAGGQTYSSRQHLRQSHKKRAAPECTNLRQFHHTNKPHQRRCNHGVKSTSWYVAYSLQESLSVVQLALPLSLHSHLDHKESSTGHAQAQQSTIYKNWHHPRHSYSSGKTSYQLITGLALHHFPFRMNRQARGFHGDRKGDTRAFYEHIKKQNREVPRRWNKDRKYTWTFPIDPVDAKHFRLPL